MGPEAAAAILSWLALAQKVHALGQKLILDAANMTPEQLKEYDAKLKASHDEIQAWQPET